MSVTPVGRPARLVILQSSKQFSPREVKVSGKPYREDMLLPLKHPLPNRVTTVLLKGDKSDTLVFEKQ
jgi:hypothetical protein